MPDHYSEGANADKIESPVTFHSLPLAMAKEMDAAEAHAQSFLDHLGLGPVRYEPDGNQPPDFLTANGIAVEVRRLNQHRVAVDGHTALEHDAFPIMHGFERLLTTYGPSEVRGSWWARYTFRRPIAQWRDIEPQARIALDEIAVHAGITLEQWPVEKNFRLSTIPCSGPQPQLFMFSGYNDRDSGGWLLHELRQNATICIQQKTKKIARVRGRYDRWWLVLVDQIGLGSSLLEGELFAEQVRIEHDWDRVVVLNPTDPTRWHDVQKG